MRDYLRRAQSVFSKLAIGESPFEDRKFDLPEQEQEDQQEDFSWSKVASALGDLMSFLEATAPAEETRIIQLQKLTII